MATTVTELMEELQKMPADAYVVLVIEDKRKEFQSVASGGISAELEPGSGDVVLTGEDD